MKFTTLVLSLAVIGASWACASAPALAEVVNATTGELLFRDDFESLGSNVSHAAVGDKSGDYNPAGGEPGFWKLKEPNPTDIQVTDHVGYGDPGAYEGSNYLRIYRNGDQPFAAMWFADQNVAGQRIRMTFMCYVPLSTKRMGVLQIVGSGDAKRFYFFTDVADPVAKTGKVLSSVAGERRDSGVVYTGDQWQKWIVDYVVGESTFSLTVVDAAGNANSASNVGMVSSGGLRRISFFGVIKHKYYVDEVPQPATQPEGQPMKQ